MLRFLSLKQRQYRQVATHPSWLFSKVGLQINAWQINRDSLTVTLGQSQNCKFACVNRPPAIDSAFVQCHRVEMQEDGTLSSRSHFCCCDNIHGICSPKNWWFWRDVLGFRRAPTTRNWIMKIWAHYIHMLHITSPGPYCNCCNKAESFDRCTCEVDSNNDKDSK